MAPFVVTHDTPLSPDAAWARVTDWPRHERFVPLTRIEIGPAGPTGVGGGFTAVTRLGRMAAVADPMEIVTWDAPRHARIVKRGRLLHGWAEITVEPQAGGARVTWREDVRVARQPAFLDRPGRAVARLLFGRVLRGVLAD